MTSEKIKLILVDDNSIFRLGLKTAIDSFVDLQVVNQATLSDAGEIIAEQSPAISLDLSLDLVIVVSREVNSSSELSFPLKVCQDLKGNYPTLPILLISSPLDIDQIALARKFGIDGYCPLGIEIGDLVVAVHQVAKGKIYWHQFEQYNQDSQLRAHGSNSNSLSWKLIWKPPRWLDQQKHLGIKQIEAHLEAIAIRLQNEKLSSVNRLFWLGRQRELQAAYWLVKQMGGTDVKHQQSKSTNNLVLGVENQEIATPIILRQQFPLTESKLENPNSRSLFDHAIAKIESDLINSTGNPLEIDILTLETKRELMFIVIQQLEKILEELRILQIKSEELVTRKELILRDLWQSSTINFLSKHYPLPPQDGKSQLVEMLITEAELIKANNLDKIPLFTDLCAYFLFNQPLAIDNIPYRPESPEAMAHAELILHNLIIQVANGVMQFILNSFNDIEKIKYSLFGQPFFSSRAIAKFRNSLSWKSRSQELFTEPKAIFESKYYLYVINGNSIREATVYAPRQDELNQLAGLKWAFTIALETRDALAPRMKSVLSFVGGGVVYLLTEVIGRGIGLIGRGIIKGVGNTLNR